MASSSLLQLSYRVLVASIPCVIQRPYDGFRLRLVQFTDGYTGGCVIVADYEEQDYPPPARTAASTPPIATTY